MNPWYLRVKNKLERIFLKIPLLGSLALKVIQRSTRNVKRMAYKNTMFENFGFTYFGPIDGHNIEDMSNAFEAAKR